MINILNSICDSSNMVRIIKFIKDLLGIIGIIVPIILVVILSIELIKSLISNMEKQEVFNKCIKKMLIAVVIFFVPSLVNFMFNLVESMTLSNTSCWVNANDELITKLKEIENQEKIAKATAKAEERKRKQEAAELKRKQEEEAKRIALEEAQNNFQEENSYRLGNGVDPVGGKVSYSNGTFYIPSTKTSGQAGTKGTGYKGLNKYFWEKLSKLIDLANNQGYNVSVTSGWRSYESQVDSRKRNGIYAAKPGGSRHGWGIAADLSFNGTTCKGGWNCNKSAKFIHDNAGKYGLHFRLTTNPKEAWHIEPISLVER